MKLRTRKNSIRLRLTRGEIAELGARGRVEESITFGPRPTDVLTYALVVSDRVTAPSARLEGATIFVDLPAATVATWTSSEQVGIEATQLVDEASGERLSILVEKDFACLKPRTGEDDADAFPNPSAPTTTRS